MHVLSRWAYQQCVHLAEIMPQGGSDEAHLEIQFKRG